MVAKYFINGGNTNTDLNWSLSQGGANDTVKPTSADNIFFLDALTATVDAVLNCLDMTTSTNNNINVNNDINIGGNYSKSSGGNIADGGGILKVTGNVTINSNGNSAKIEFLGNDTLFTAPASLTVIGALLLNKNVGKKLTLSNTINLASFFADWTIQEGILDLGAFNLTGSGDLTQNGGSVTSTTGILDQERFFLNGGTFDPFKAISSTNSVSTLFTDSATVNLMPSGGDFEFTGANHWTINQNFTEFPHLIFNKCTTCGQNGQWYAKDVTILNNSQWGTGFLRGNLVSSGYNNGGTVTFDGTGVQSATGNVSFGRLKFNKISGSIIFNDDFRLQECEVVAGANLVDFGTTLAHILDPFDHLQFWSVAGLKFYSIELEIATTGGATMNNTVILNDFIVTQVQNLVGDITVGGDVIINDLTVGSTFILRMNGTQDQTIFVAGTSDDGTNNLFEVNKPSGILKLLSDLKSTNVNNHLHLISGLICTNGFDITVDDLTLDAGTVIQKVSPTILTVNGTTINNGAIVDVAGCSTGIVV